MPDVQYALGVELPPQKLNLDVAWGIRLGKLEYMSFSNLESIFCGMHNIDLSGSMKEHMDPREILAIYLGAGRDKYAAYIKWRAGINSDADLFDGEESRRNFFKNILIRDFEYTEDFTGIIRRLNRTAFGSQSQGRLEAHQRNFRLAANSMPRTIQDRHETERLCFLPEPVKAEFVTSFFDVYKPSNRQDPESRTFNDPNVDGYDRRIYADRIYHTLKTERERYVAV